MRSVVAADENNTTNYRKKNLRSKYKTYIKINYRIFLSFILLLYRNIFFLS